MKRVAQFLAVLVVSFVVAQATALACTCGMCTKTASASVIGPDYPAGGVPVTYTVVVDCQPDWVGSKCGTVGSVLDTPFGGTLVNEPWGFGAENGGPITRSYTVNFTWETCMAYGGEPAADGSIKVLNLVTATSPYETPDFSCQKEIICRPPTTGTGCSRTPGYWKTHSLHGPAPYDATWAGITPSGADSPFFNPPGSQTYFEVLWTDSAGGNAYYILARAFIAAKLNVLAGASVPDEVAAAMDWANTSFFPTYGPASTLPKATRGLALAYAGVIDNYNNGLIGPGHCP